MERPALANVAAWASRKLSASVVLGLGFIWLTADRLPPFLAGAAPAAPVEVVRAVPVPYLDPTPPEPARILRVAARRTQARAQDRPQSQREGESGAPGKAGAGTSAEKAPAAADPKAAAPADAKSGAKSEAKSDGKSDTKPDAAKTEPPPDVWSDGEIIAALRDCLRKLAPLGADIEIAEPVKHERCGAPAPVLLKRMGTSAGKVEFQPPPMLNCAMVASLHTWVEKTLEPAAQELLGSPVVRIRNVSGYACRNRVGTTIHADRLSEHALANAVDISGFVTADGRSIDVERQWGPTVRELREAQERTWTAAQDAKAAAREAEKQAAAAARAARAVRGKKQAGAKAEAERLKAEWDRKQADAQQQEAAWRKTLARSAELQRLGRGVDDREAARPRRGDKNRQRSAEARGLTPVRSDARSVPDRSADAKAPAGKDEDKTPAETVFLRRLHKGACGTFGTVLGPDANEAHHNHFHFDLAARKHSAFCE
jgi:hypothetical protein